MCNHQVSPHPVIIIPAYQPTESLLTLIHDINEYFPEQRIIVVNDGSKGSAVNIFKKLTAYKNIKIIEHSTNLGKGQALKTAFHYFLLHFDVNAIGVVTADADGQHTVSDIYAIINQFSEFPDCVFLGARTLNEKVPWRSRFGNSLTRKIFKLIVGKDIVDTQTGLRGIPRSVLNNLLKIPSSRYEYELEMLILLIHNKIEIKEVPIQTIYIENNKSSHFHPILDSLKVYLVFFRYLVTSSSTFFKHIFYK